MRLTSRRKTRRAGIAVLAAVWAASFLMPPSRSAAQAPDEKTDAPPVKKAGKALPALVKLALETKDGVQLYVEYLPGAVTEAMSKAGLTSKDIVPVVLLHMAKGSGADWKPLAEWLQRAGHAVIVPDLRGHGQSTQINRGGRTATIDQATMRKADYDAMVLYDMERIKKFIIEENNKEKLNLRKLCVVGAEMGAAVAINWAALDWSWPPLATGPQGQDVNGLVLITPIWGHKGMSIVNATKNEHVQRSISAMIIVGGKDSANINDARRLHQILQKYHDEPPAAQAAEKKDLFFVTLPTSLQGTKMLGEKSLGLEGDMKGDVKKRGPILEFIQLRLVNKKFEWAKRDRPLD